MLSSIKQSIYSKLDTLPNLSADLYDKKYAEFWKKDPYVVKHKSFTYMLSNEVQQSLIKQSSSIAGQPC